MIDQADAQLIADLLFTRLANSQKIAYSIKSAASACDCSPRTIEDAIASGTLKASKPGRQWIITRENLETWLRRC